jgi:hypothetical protein
MTNQHEEKKGADRQNNDAAVQSDPETLHTTDPQKKMEGPISSAVQKVKDLSNESESKEKADEKKERNM